MISVTPMNSAPLKRAGSNGVGKSSPGKTQVVTDKSQKQSNETKSVNSNGSTPRVTKSGPKVTQPSPPRVYTKSDFYDHFGHKHRAYENRKNFSEPSGIKPDFSASVHTAGSYFRRKDVSDWGYRQRCCFGCGKPGHILRYCKHRVYNHGYKNNFYNQNHNTGFHNSRQQNHFHNNGNQNSFHNQGYQNRFYHREYNNKSRLYNRWQNNRFHNQKGFRDEDSRADNFRYQTQGFGNYQRYQPRNHEWGKSRNAHSPYFYQKGKSNQGERRVLRNKNGYKPKVDPKVAKQPEKPKVYQEKKVSKEKNNDEIPKKPNDILKDSRTGVLPILVDHIKHSPRILIDKLFKVF